jgi:hypothetical protein
MHADGTALKTLRDPHYSGSGQSHYDHRGAGDAR